MSIVGQQARADIRQRESGPRDRGGRKRHGYRPNRRDDRRVAPKSSLYDPQLPGRLQARAELRAVRLTVGSA